MIRVTLKKYVSNISPYMYFEPIKFKKKFKNISRYPLSNIFLIII